MAFQMKTKEQYMPQLYGVGKFLTFVGGFTVAMYFFSLLVGNAILGGTMHYTLAWFGATWLVVGYYIYRISLKWMMKEAIKDGEEETRTVESNDQ